MSCEPRPRDRDEPRRRPRRAASFVTALGLAVVLAGCARGALIVDASDAVVRSDVAGSPPSLVKDGPHRTAVARNVLVLTSGGADGAFGAGVLAAWSDSGKRPAFDVVSGTSTGALQATAAFLGPDYDPLLKRVYTATQTRDVFRSNGLKTLLGTGLYDPAHLRRLLMAAIDEEMLDVVAAACRRLYVTTTDMTAGRTVIWDMGAIAASGGDRRERYVDLLVASAAVPGLVEPSMFATTGTAALPCTATAASRRRCL